MISHAPVPCLRRRSLRVLDAVSLSTAAMVAVLTTGGLLLAHEGHDSTVRPIYKEIQTADRTYRVGFAMMPQDPLVGEDVRFEIRVAEQTGRTPEGAPIEVPVTLQDPQVRIISNDGAVPASRIVTGDKPDVFGARHRFTQAGDYGISPRVQVGSQSVTAEFAVLVAPGPVVLAAVPIDAVILLGFGAFAFSLWRARQKDPANGPSGARLGAVIAGGAVVLVGAHVWMAPGVGRLFLPERHFGAVAWQNTAPGEDAPAGTPHVDPPGTPPHTHPPGTPPHDHPPAAPKADDGGAPLAARDLISTVVPVPGQVVDVMVPVSARVLFEGFTPRVGRSVRRGQTLAMLEHHYVLHDAVHLINQRWLYMVPMLATRRASLETELRAARLRHLRETGEPQVRQMLEVTRAVETADLEVETARLEHQKAATLLSMHDAQITQRELVRRPLASPIDGTIEAVNFTQGQLKYENDKLFTILDLSRVWVDVRIPGELASRRPPERMAFTSPAFPSVRFEGRLARVANALDPETGTLSAFFEVSNPERLLRVGMRLAAAGEQGRTAAGTTSDRVVRTSAAPDAVDAPSVSLAGTIKASPELTADVTAPLWGRIEFAGRRLNVGDRVRKGETLLNVILELSVDERYPMNARAVEINSELELARTRLAQAEQQWKDAVAQLKTAPNDPFKREEVQLLERIHRNAQTEEGLLARQAEAYKGTIERRDPKITPVTAPISGVITQIGFRPGELNGTGEFRQLLTIVDPSRVWIEAPAYDLQSAMLLKGFTRGSFTVPGMGPRRLDRPVALSGAVNPETGALRVTFEVPNPGGALKIGAPVQIVLARD